MRSSSPSLSHRRVLSIGDLRVKLSALLGKQIETSPEPLSSIERKQKEILAALATFPLRMVLHHPSKSDQPLFGI